MHIYFGRWLDKKNQQEKRWWVWSYQVIPIGSMYAIYGNMYHQYTPNVSIYTIHGSYGILISMQGATKGLLASIKTRGCLKNSIIASVPFLPRIFPRLFRNQHAPRRVLNNEYHDSLYSKKNEDGILLRDCLYMIFPEAMVMWGSSRPAVQFLWCFWFSHDSRAP